MYLLSVRTLGHLEIDYPSIIIIMNRYMGNIWRRVFKNRLSVGGFVAQGLLKLSISRLMLMISLRTNINISN